MSYAEIARNHAFKAVKVALKNNEIAYGYYMLSFLDLIVSKNPKDVYKNFRLAEQYCMESSWRGSQRTTDQNTLQNLFPKRDLHRVGAFSSQG